MYCENCGKELKEGDLFCENCGAKVPKTDAEIKVGSDDNIQKAVEAFLGGDRNAFQVIYQDTYKDVYKIARAFFPDSVQDCEDCIQVAYTRAYEKFSLYAPEKGRFLPWLKTVAGNVCKDEYDRIKKKKGAEQSIDGMGYDDTSDLTVEFADEDMTFNPEARADREETIRMIRKIIANLPEKLAQTVMLYYGGEYKQEELAGILGISLPAVKKRLKTGKKMVEEQVLALEKRGTKLYGMAPIAFFAWLLANDTMQAEAAGAFVYNGTGHGSSPKAHPEQSSQWTPEDVISQAAGATGQSAASSSVSAGVAGAGMAAAIKIIAGIAAAAVIGGGAYAGVKVYQDRGGLQEGTDTQEEIKAPDPEAEALMKEIDTEELAVQLVAGCPLYFEEITNTFSPNDPIDSQQLYDIYKRNIYASMTGAEGVSYLDETVAVTKSFDLATADLSIFDNINQVYGISDELVSQVIQGNPYSGQSSYTEELEFTDNTVTWSTYAPDIVNTAKVNSLDLTGGIIEVEFTVSRLSKGSIASDEDIESYTATLMPADNEFGYQITSIQYLDDGNEAPDEDAGTSGSEPFLSMEEIDSYKTLTKEYGKFFYGTGTGESIFDNDRGMMDPYHGMGPGASEDYPAIYYALYDMNGDGIDECFFTSDPGTEQTDTQGYYGIWTMVYGKPVRFADCGYRTHQYLCEDGMLRSEYSGGAEVSDIYYYAIGEDGAAEEVEFVGYDWDDYEEKRSEVAALEAKHPRREGLEFDWIKIEK